PWSVLQIARKSAVAGLMSGLPVLIPCVEIIFLGNTYEISVGIDSKSGHLLAAASQTLDVRNASGLRMSVDPDDGNPALIIEVPDGPEGKRSSKILFPEHVTVRAHGQSEP